MPMAIYFPTPAVAAAFRSSLPREEPYPMVALNSARTPK